MKRLGIFFILGMLLMTCCHAEGPTEREQQVKGYVALTFDDGPSGHLTETLLEGLEERNARATFFLCGYRIDVYEALLQKYLSGGHELGVHSTIHTDLTKLAPEAVEQDLSQTARKIYDATGVTPKFCRPPGGAWNDTVLREAEKQGLAVALWSVDPEDWKQHSVQNVLSAMSREAGDGDIILMHDLSESSITAALNLIDYLQGLGYEFVTLSELMALKGQTPVPGRIYRDFSD